MVELSIHFERLETPVSDVVRNSNLQWVFLCNPPAGTSPFPKQRIVGRFIDSEEQRLVGMGASGADEWWFRNEGKVRAAPYLYALITCNEPPKDRPDVVVPYLIRWSTLCKQKFPNLKRAGPNWSNGCPEPEVAPTYAAAYRLLDIHTFHEYWVPEHWQNAQAWVGWLMGRYVKFTANLPVDLRNKPIMITEAGCDALSLATLGRPPVEEGWKIRYPSREAYMVDIKKYAELLKIDSRVWAVFFYEAGPWPRWTTYEVDVPLANDILSLNSTPSTPPPAPTPAPGPTVEARLLALEEKYAAMQGVLSHLTTVDAFGLHLVHKKD